MSIPRPSWPFSRPASFLLAGGSFLFSVMWLGLWKLDPQIFREHGPMENVQLGFLGISAVFTMLALRKLPNAAGRTFVVGLMLLHVTFVVHEFDVRAWPQSSVQFFLRGAFRNMVLIGAWLGGLMLFMRRAGAAWEYFTEWLQTKSAGLMEISGLFWLLGGGFDKLAPFGRENNMMAEELMEVNGALFMMSAMVTLFWSCTGRPEIAREAVPGATAVAPESVVSV